LRDDRLTLDRIRDSERDVYLVLNDFGRAWCETAEADTESPILIRWRFGSPVRIIAVNTAAGSALLLGQCSRDAPRYLIVGRLLSNDRYDGSGSFCDRRDGPCPRAGLHVLASAGSNRVGLAGRACLDDNRSSRVS